MTNQYNDVMKIFKKINAPSRQDELASQIAKKVIQVQHNLADSLNKKVKNQSGNRQLIGLAIFSLIFGGYCIYLLISAIQ